MGFSLETKFAHDALSASLLEQLGIPTGARVTRNRGVAFLWTLNADGDGVAIARSATRGGLDRQVDRLLALDADFSIRTLVVAANLCGNRRFEERPDLLEVRNGIDEGWCRFVAVAALDRISRARYDYELFLSYLNEHGVRLVVANADSTHIELDPSSLALQMLGVAAQTEIGKRLRRER